MPLVSTNCSALSIPSVITVNWDNHENVINPCLTGHPHEMMICAQESVVLWENALGADLKQSPTPETLLCIDELGLRLIEDGFLK